MHKLNTHLVGLTLGSLVALLHVIWAILIATGFAKALLDFILYIHHIEVSYSIMQFSLGVAVALIVVTFIIGYIFGSVFAILWNKFQK